MQQLLTRITSDHNYDDVRTSTNLSIDLETIKACENENTGTDSLSITGKSTYIYVGTRCCLIFKAVAIAQIQTDESFLLNHGDTIDHLALSTHTLID